MDRSIGLNEVKFKLKKVYLNLLKFVNGSGSKHTYLNLKKFTKK